MRPSKTIMSAAIGLALSTSLGACAHRAPKLETPVHTQVIAVPLKETPPADLMVCAQRPDGFPEDLVATMPLGIRDAAKRVMKALKDDADRLDRWVNYHAPGSCPAPNPTSP